MINRLPNIGLIFVIISAVLASWLLIHLLAFFGVFVAFAYPIWWFIFPTKVSCFFCQTRKDGQKCPFCKHLVHKAEGTSPKNFRSVALNTALLLVFSIVSFVLVMAESRILFKAGFPPTPKTVSFIIPNKGQYKVGETFPMPIEIIGIKTPINAVQADFAFDSSKLELVDITTDGSFANIFIQKEINNDYGYGRLTGGLPNPGFFSDHGMFGTIFFKAITPGPAQVEFLDSSLVLANDGRGTNVLKDFAEASYLIIPDDGVRAGGSQNEVDFKPIVLGDASDDTQMIFYEQDEKVLGTETQAVNAEKSLSGEVFNTFMKYLEITDRAIINFWSKVFRIDHIYNYENPTPTMNFSTELPKPQQFKSMKLTSPAFSHNGKLDVKYSCFGDVSNPTLDLQNIPANTRSLLMFLESRDSASGPLTHWMIANIDPASTHISENKSPDGSFRISNLLSECPDSDRKYTYKIYALDIKIENPQDKNIKDIEAIINGHILEGAEISANFAK